ncbi:MAG TPA: lysophospholipid acyltransferase family protein [Candidatus Dormibacteraeota bacterium]|nr:lysophospholipid acyltransferase family protein [Candidatus Dormibacteraeota bacterium]
MLRALGPARHPVADAIGLAAWAANPSRRRRAAANHLRLGATGEAEARRLARRSFQEYVRTNVDFVWAHGMSAAEVASRSRVAGRDHIDEAVAAGRGGVLALSHFGNWDFAALIAWSYGVQLTTVMAPIGNQTVTRLVVWAREQNALEVFAPENAARGLLRAVRRGRFVALLSDIAGAGPEVAVRYCGGLVAFSLAPAWLAMRTNAPLLPVDCRRGERGEPDYVITIHERLVPAEGEDEAALTQRLATTLEVAVRRHPQQWYPFGDVYSEGASGD